MDRCAAFQCFSRSTHFKLDLNKRPPLVTLYCYISSRDSFSQLTKMGTHHQVNQTKNTRLFKIQIKVKWKNGELNKIQFMYSILYNVHIQQCTVLRQYTAHKLFIFYSLASHPLPWGCLNIESESKEPRMRLKKC